LLDIRHLTTWEETRVKETDDPDAKKPWGIVGGGRKASYKPRWGNRLGGSAVDRLGFEKTQHLRQCGGARVRKAFRKNRASQGTIAGTKRWLGIVVVDRPAGQNIDISSIASSLVGKIGPTGGSTNLNENCPKKRRQGPFKGSGAEQERKV